MENNCSSLQLLAAELTDSGEERLQELVDNIYEFALNAYRNGDNSLTENTCIRTLELLDRVSGVIKGKGSINRLLANVYNRQDNFKDSLRCNLTAAEQLLTAGDVKTAAAVYSNCGALLFHLNDKAGAYEKQLLALNLAEKHGLNYEKAKTLLNMAIILQGRREFKEALRFTEQAKNILVEISNNWGIAYALAAIASLKKSMGDFQGCFDYHQMALDIRKELGDEKEILLSLINSATALITLKKPLEAEQTCREALQFTTGSKYPSLKSLVLINLIEALLDQNLPEQSMLVVCEVRELFSTFDGFEDDKSELVNLESKVLYALGRHREAYLALRRHIDMDVTISSESRDEEISRMRIATEIETSLREKEAIAQKNIELEITNNQLRDALKQVKTLSGMLPICASCKRIRDDDGYWQQLESYISEHSSAQFSHGLCTECMEKALKKIEE